MDVTINGVTTEDVSLPEAFDMLADACFEWKNWDADHHGHMFYAASLEVGMMCIRAAEKYMAEQNRQREMEGKDELLKKHPIGLLAAGSSLKGWRKKQE